MPRFLAYICPRTDRIFKEKDDYVEHLRKLARASLQDKRIARESHALRLDFAKLRESATDQEDVLEWLYANIAEIMQVAFTIKPVLASKMRKITTQASARRLNCSDLRISHTGLGHQVDENISVPFTPKYGDLTLIAGSIGIQPYVSTRIDLLEAFDTFLFVMPGIQTNFVGNELWLYLYAEDWPFVAKKALYELREPKDDIEQDYSLERIISRRFPSVTFEQYRGLCLSGLFEEEMLGEAAITNWLEHGYEDAHQLPPLEDQSVGSP